MKTLSTILTVILTLTCTLAQEAFHDPVLDQINGQVANVDADINGYFQQNGPWLSISNVSQFGAVAMSNQAALTSQITNSGGTNSSRLVNAWSNILGGIIYTNSGNLAGTSTNNNLQLGSFKVGTSGQNVSFSMNLSPDPDSRWGAIFTAVRGCIIAMVYLALFRYSITYIQSETFSTMCQRQMAGTNQEILGFNASAPSALTYCAIITGSLVTLLGVIATTGFVRLALTVANTLSPSLAGLLSSQAFNVVTAMFPLSDVIGAYTAYIVFRYIIAFPLFFTIRGFMFWMIR